MSGLPSHPEIPSHSVSCFLHIHFVSSFNYSGLENQKGDELSALALREPAWGQGQTMGQMLT